MKNISKLSQQFSVTDKSDLFVLFVPWKSVNTKVKAVKIQLAIKNIICRCET